MAGLSLDLFLGADGDLERAQYQILGGLQGVRAAFSRNIIYPYLGELIDLYGTLQGLLQQFGDFKQRLKGDVRDVDLEAKTLVFDIADMGADRVAYLEELIDWALPRVQEAIEEGRTIFEFVDENLFVEEVGIVPSYVEEGYLIVPDRITHTVHILQYNLSIFTSAKERYRSLKTTHVKSLAQRGIYVSPHSIKLDLLAENRDLPNPATYFFATDLDFPFEPTMLPVAKRKLMRYLFDRGAAA
jgi:hypothetical protein